MATFSAATTFSVAMATTHTSAATVDGATTFPPAFAAAAVLFVDSAIQIRPDKGVEKATVQLQLACTYLVHLGICQQDALPSSDTSGQRDGRDCGGDGKLHARSPPLLLRGLD
jgi:hypothetical protein